VEIVGPGGDPAAGSSGVDQNRVWQSTLLPDDQSPILRQPRFDEYAEVGYAGTSMATPHVAALAALLISEGITNPKTIEAVIKGTAKDLGAAGHDAQYGYGLVQPRAALFGLGIRK
jgi:subtilisin family serine protease